MRLGELTVGWETYPWGMSQTIDPAVAQQVNGLADRARVASRRLALLSRAEAVAMLDRLLERGPLHEAPQQWPDVPPSH